MTLIVVIASRDSISFLGDTRTVGDVLNPTLNQKLYYEHTQKVFYSLKHKIGLCIAKDNTLVDPCAPNDKNKILQVPYIMKEFFSYLDTLDDVKVDQLDQKLHDFILCKFGTSYIAGFKSKVQMLFGGFLDTGATAIFSYENGLINDKFEYTNAMITTKLCALSNFQEGLDEYSKDVVSSPQCQIAGVNATEKQNKLFASSNNRNSFFNGVICRLRTYAIGQSGHEIDVGEYFQYVQIGKVSGNFRKLEYKIQDNKFAHLCFHEYITFHIASTQTDFETKLLAEEIKAFMPNGAQVTFTPTALVNVP